MTKRELNEVITECQKAADILDGVSRTLAVQKARIALGTIITEAGTLKTRKFKTA